MISIAALPINSLGKMNAMTKVIKTSPHPLITILTALACTFSLAALAGSGNKGPIGVEAKGQLDACNANFTGAEQGTELTEWRKAFMHPNSDQSASASFAKTTPARENLIKARVQSMINYIWVDGDIPDMEFVPEEGVTSESLRAANYNTGAIPQVMISGVGPSGKLRMTLLLPVSGHNGWSNAARWSKTDTYKVWFQGAGASQPTAIITGAKSLDFITTHEVEIQLDPNQVVRVLYARDGSAGVGGFASGRTIEFKWDGT